MKLALQILGVLGLGLCLFVLLGELGLRIFEKTTHMGFFAPQYLSSGDNPGGHEFQIHPMYVAWVAALIGAALLWASRKVGASPTKTDGRAQP